MHDLYVKLMTKLLGPALGTSDRVKVAVGGAVSTALLYLVAHCGACAVILTPDVLTHLTIVITGYVLTLIYSIGQRDTLTSAQEAAKAAAPVASLAIAPGSPLPPRLGGGVGNSGGDGAGFVAVVSSAPVPVPAAAPVIRNNV